MLFQATSSEVAGNEDWCWPALGGTCTVPSEDIQWLEMSAFPTESSLQPAHLYSYGVSAYDGDEVPLDIQPNSDGDMVGSVLILCE